MGALAVYCLHHVMFTTVLFGVPAAIAVLCGA